MLIILASLLLSEFVGARSSSASSYGLAYEGAFVYSLDGNGNRTLESIAFDEGRILKSGSSFVADYHIKDHLGSVRAVVRNGNIIEENDYYPYGAKMAKPGLVSQTSPVPNRYLFSSKEDQAVAFGSYGLDFGARDYAHDGLTWFEPDPLASKYYHLSPYTYCAGNPLKFLDKEGKTPDLAWDLVWVGIDTFNVLKSYVEGDTEAVNHNLKILGGDVLAACIPGIPATAGVGAAAAKLFKAAANNTKLLSNFKHAAEFGIDSYKNLRKAVLNKFGKNSGLEVHHVIEKRFAKVLDMASDDIPSIVLTKEEHKAFTKAWREAIGYNTNGVQSTIDEITKDKVISAAKNIYSEYPEISKIVEKL